MVVVVLFVVVGRLVVVVVVVVGRAVGGVRPLPQTPQDLNKD